MIKRQPMSEASVDIGARFADRRERRQASQPPRRGPDGRWLKADSPELPAQPTPRRIDRRPQHERMPISAEQIIQLRDKAALRQDTFFVRVCERALDGDQRAIDACKAALYGLA